MKLGYVLILSGSIMMASFFIYRIIAEFFGFIPRLIGHATPPECYPACFQIMKLFEGIAIIGFLLIISGIVYFIAKRNSQKLNKVILLVGAGMTAVGAGFLLTAILIANEVFNQPLLEGDFGTYMGFGGLWILLIGIFTLGVRGLVALVYFVEILKDSFLKWRRTSKEFPKNIGKKS